MPAAFTLRHATPQDWDDVAELIYLSTNFWYQAHGKSRIFHGPPLGARLFCEVYEALDPGRCILAVGADTGRIIGSCFYHPRPTHVSLGIMNAHPSHAGAGVARELLRFIIDFAQAEGKPLRLVSSAMNLDSFSLYNRAGLAPYAVYQDMILTVPPHGLAAPAPPAAGRLRDATLEDVGAMVALEREVHGIDRTKDFEYFINNKAGIWHVSVMEGEGRALRGFLVSVAHPASSMLGPGVMRDEADAAALIHRELDVRRGHTMVWLIPSDRPALIAPMYALGAKNCEIHFAQVLGPKPVLNGIVLPTFMPETS